MRKGDGRVTKFQAKTFIRERKKVFYSCVTFSLQKSFPTRLFPIRYSFDAVLISTQYKYSNTQTIKCQAITITSSLTFLKGTTNNVYCQRIYCLPLDETHLDAVRGLILLRGFRPAHQQVELVRAMRLRSTRTNRSASCLCQGLDSRLKNLD